MIPAIEMPKVARFCQRGRNGGGVKVFWVPHLCDTLSKILKFFFRGIAPTYAQDNSSSRWESRFSHSCQLWEIQPPKDPPFPGFSRFCQSLAPNDVTAVADTRACYTSLERAQKIEQNGTNTIFNFAFLGKPRPPKVGTLKKRHFAPSSKQRRIGYAWRNLTQLTRIILHIVNYYNPKFGLFIFTFLEVVRVQNYKNTQFAKKSVFCNVLASASKKPAMLRKVQLYIAIVYKLDNTHRKNKKNRSSIKRVIRYQSFKNTQLVGCTTFMKLRTLTQRESSSDHIS